MEPWRARGGTARSVAIVAMAAALALGAALCAALGLAGGARAAGPDDEAEGPGSAGPDTAAPPEAYVPPGPAAGGGGRIVLGGGAVEAHPGEYWGVVPGSTRPAPGRPKAKPGGVQIFAWIGFQMLESGGSRIYVVTTNPVPHEIVETSSDKIVIELSNVRVLLSNHLRFIDTAFFSTYVKKIETKRWKKNKVRVTIHLRAPFVPTVERVGDFLFVEFPAPSFG
ncbi:MAG TPA: AMIN domain-containing protein [Myxococcota bacterium]|nr:AMIN domain-containing protein [Myxococcota bacterium]